MAFLTHFSFGKLCREVDIKQTIDKELFVKQIYNNGDLFYILNKHERNYLLSYKALLDDEKDFRTVYYQQVPIQEDKKIYVFEKTSNIKYHLSKDCQFLTSDFQDFYIPDQIRSINNEELTTIYRAWFKGHGFKEEYLNSLKSGETQRVKKKIVDDYNYKFRNDNPKFNLEKLHSKFEFFRHIDNSKSKFAEDKFDKTKFINEIELLIKEHDEYFHSHNLRTFSKYSKMVGEPDDKIKLELLKVFELDVVKRFGIEKIREAWTVSNTIKKEILQLLCKQFRWTYQFHEKDFDTLTLEDFGLICCSRCKEEAGMK